MRERSASGAETDSAAVVIAARPMRCCSSAAASVGLGREPGLERGPLGRLEAAVGVGGERRLVSFGEGLCSVIGRSKQ